MDPLNQIRQLPVEVKAAEEDKLAFRASTARRRSNERDGMVLHFARRDRTFFDAQHQKMVRRAAICVRAAIRINQIDIWAGHEGRALQVQKFDQLLVSSKAHSSPAELRLKSRAIARHVVLAQAKTRTSRSPNHSSACASNA